jgi:GDP-4-dehydro-6-deoxy-D-mannose reductase
VFANEISRAFRGIPGLSYHRDYLDARDVCDAFLQLLTLAPAERQGGVVNLYSGESQQVRGILEQLIRPLRPAEIQRCLDQITEAPGRADDIPWIVGDPGRFETIAGGWARHIALEQTLRDACRSE